MQSRTETTPKALRALQDHDSVQKSTPISRKNQKSSVSTINYSLIDSPPSKFKKYLGPISTISKSCKHTSLIEILSYASTSPRPFLCSESTTPITCYISPKGSEFGLLFSLLRPFSKTLTRALKTYTHSLISSLPNKTNTLGFLSNSLNFNKIRLLFLFEEPNQLENICTEGWASTSVNPNTLILASKIDNPSRFMTNGNPSSVVAVLVARDSLKKLHKGVYTVCDANSSVVPVYLLEFTSD